MATPYITIGCPTTGGGVVQEGDDSFLIEGIPIACVGHKATCPLHKTVSTIISGDQYFKVGGKPAARAGDSLSCGCKLLPKQSLVVGDNGGSLGSAIPVLNSDSFLSEESNVFEDKFKLVSESGEPLKRINYVITRADGTTETGTTDNLGFTHVVNTKDQSEIISIKATHDF